MTSTHYHRPGPLGRALAGLAVEKFHGKLDDHESGRVRYLDKIIDIAIAS
jgi:hypothetical protein